MSLPHIDTHGKVDNFIRNRFFCDKSTHVGLVLKMAQGEIDRRLANDAIHALCAKTARDEATQTIVGHPATKHFATTVPRKTLPHGLLFVLQHPRAGRVFWMPSFSHNGPHCT